MSSGGRTFLGIDLGTTNVKAQIVAEDGTVISCGSAPVQIRYGADGAAEQDMEDIWTGTTAAVRQAVGSGVAPEVAAMGVSSQGGALQLLDRAGHLEGPVIGWQDGRGGPWDRELTSRKGGEWFARHVGMPRSFISAGQILRLRERKALPEAFRLGWVGDVVVGRLCGRRAHDGTSLSEAGLYNPSKGREDEELLALLGIAPGILPDLLSATQAAGGLLPELAASLGLPAGIPVGPAVHDQYAAALGCGVTRPGDTMLGAGTAWVLLALAATLDPPVGGISLVGRHPAPGVYGQMLSMVNGGACITWASRLLNLGSMGVKETDAFMSQAPAGSDGLRFRPLLTELGGAGLPPGTAGRLEGLRLGHTPAHLLRSLAEGLACELGRYLDMAQRGGVTVRRLVMCGKAATSTVTPQIIADTTGLPVDCMTVPETSSLGAAVLARALVTPDADLVALSASMVPDSGRVEPGPGRADGQRRLGEYLCSFAAVSP